MGLDFDNILTFFKDTLPSVAEATRDRFVAGRFTIQSFLQIPQNFKALPELNPNLVLRLLNSPIWWSACKAKWLQDITNSYPSFECNFCLSFTCDIQIPEDWLLWALTSWQGLVYAHLNQCWSGINFWTYESGPSIGYFKKIPNQPGSFLKLSYQSTRPGIESKTDFWHFVTLKKWRKIWFFFFFFFFFV